MKKREFGDLENDILMVLKSKKRATVNCVLEALSTDDKYTTIMTVMARLVAKGVLGRQRMGLRYEYWIAEGKEKPDSILKRACSKLFGLKTADVVSYLINQSKNLSDEELDEVEKIIAEAKKKNRE